MALQRAAKARLYKLLLNADVQSRRPDLIEFGGMPVHALPRDKHAVGTARRRLQRLRAGAVYGQVYIHILLCRITDGQKYRYKKRMPADSN
jgi:hypothetical protein